MVLIKGIRVVKLYFGYFVNFFSFGEGGLGSFCLSKKKNQKITKTRSTDSQQRVH